jgi:hypothetical protein
MGLVRDTGGCGESKGQGTAAAATTAATAAADEVILLLLLLLLPLLHKLV